MAAQNISDRLIGIIGDPDWPSAPTIRSYPQPAFSLRHAHHQRFQFRLNGGAAWILPVTVLSHRTSWRPVAPTCCSHTDRLSYPRDGWFEFLDHTGSCSARVFIFVSALLLNEDRDSHERGRDESPTFALIL